MYTKIYENPNIYKIDVPLPKNPLRNLNCYVIQDKGESLIIDTGFNQPECEEALLAGLEALEIDWGHTDMFLTHMHSDHVGLVPAVMQGKPGKTYMSKIDHDYLLWNISGDRWVQYDDFYIKQGFSRQQVDWLRYENPARAYGPTEVFPVVTVEDGDEIRVGDYTFSAVFVPGHTPGQMCLYCEAEQLMFTGDHVLFDITPNITWWSGVEDSLGDYILSLLKLRKYPMELAFPAHRKNDKDVYERIDEIIVHHYIRLQETLDAIDLEDGVHATDIGAKLKWSMRGKSWDDFPLSQRWFAVGETMSHLDYLIVRGLVDRTENNGLFAYWLTAPLDECKERLSEIWKQY